MDNASEQMAAFQAHDPEGFKKAMEAPVEKGLEFGINSCENFESFKKRKPFAACENHVKLTEDQKPEFINLKR